MNKTVFGALAVVLMLTAGATVRGKSIVYPLQASIPFDFYVGDTMMHQGQYEVSTQFSGGAIMVRGPQKAVMIMANPENQRTGKAEDQLEFNHINGEYFLTSIWTAEDAAGYGLPRSRREKEVMAKGGNVEITLVPGTH